MPSSLTTHQLILVERARLKIETGVFTRFFTRPVLVLCEIFTYALSLIAFLAGVVFWNKLDAIIVAADEIIDTVKIFAERRIDHQMLDNVDTVALLFALMPFIILLLLARLFTSSRRRIAKLREIESILEQVLEEQRISEVAAIA